MQASGVLSMGRWPETCHPKSPFSGNTPPPPGIAQIKSRHGPVAGTRAVWRPWPWETSPGLPARRPKLPQMLHPRRKTTHPIIQQGTKVRASARGERHRSGLPAQRARSQLASSSSSPPFLSLSCPLGKCCLDNAVDEFGMPFAGIHKSSPIQAHE